MTATPPPTRSNRRPSRDRVTPVYVISIAAELTGVHAQTLRNYERHGLLAPARSRGGNRRYSDADLARIRRINELTNDGLPLSGVQRIMELEQRIAELTAPTALMTRRAAQLPPPRSPRHPQVPSPTTTINPTKGAHRYGHTRRV